VGADGPALRRAEIDPHYAHVAIERWETFTGERAQRVDGSPLSGRNGAASVLGGDGTTPHEIVRLVASVRRFGHRGACGT